MAWNPAYGKGRRKEYAIIKAAKEKGCEIAFRSAGSHSPIDVVVINIPGKEIFFIQSKPDYISAAYKARLEQEWASLNDSFKVRFIVR